MWSPLKSLTLRERKEDIPELVSYFLKKFNRDLKKEIVGITSAAMTKITSYGWPGNVRQLENVLKRAMVLCQGEWILEDQLLLEKGWEKREEDLEQKAHREPPRHPLRRTFKDSCNLTGSGHDLYFGKGADSPGVTKDQGESGPSRPASRDQSKHPSRQDGEVSF